MRSMVLLRHELADGTRHFDWLIDPGSPRALLTFRVKEPIHTGDSRNFAAEMIGDHRRMYLDFEGPIPGGRGRIVRVARGALEALGEQQGRIVIRASLGGLTGVFVGRHTDGPWWRFAVTPLTVASDSRRR